LPLTREYNLQLLEFDCGVELRVAGKNKGDAVREIISETGPSAVLAYLGDDFTDEDAFKILKGRGLCVLVREELRKTSADIWLKPPKELLEFLQNWQ